MDILGLRPGLDITMTHIYWTSLRYILQQRIATQQLVTMMCRISNVSNIKVIIKILTKKRRKKRRYILQYHKLSDFQHARFRKWDVVVHIGLALGRWYPHVINVRKLNPQPSFAVGCNW